MKKMKKLLFFIYILCSFTAFCQQENHYTQFMYNKLLLNPAFAGAREVTTVSAMYRQQWAGFEGAPVSQLISFDSPILGKKIGLGFNLHHHTIGQVNDNFMANIDYSYSLIKTKEMNLKLGLGGTFRYFKMDLFNLNTGSVGLDPAQLSSTENRVMNGNIGLGVYFAYKEFYIGASVPNLISNKLGNLSSTPTAQTKPHFYGMMGAMLPIADKIDIKPALIVKYSQDSPFSTDANVSFVFNKKFNLGASYRTGYSTKGESIDALVFFQINEKMGIGASYDYGLSDLKKYHNGSYELLLRYDFNNTQKNIYSNPRFFF
jgi:type IX secretion system PorP/SprF family membrane protein